MRRVSGSMPPADQPTPRCPRCGGVARPHRRRNAWANPFLPKAKTEITCEDCGLDFDPATMADTVKTPPEEPKSAGRTPWHKD